MNIIRQPLAVFYSKFPPSTSRLVFDLGFRISDPENPRVMSFNDFLPSFCGNYPEARFIFFLYIKEIVEKFFVSTLRGLCGGKRVVRVVRYHVDTILTNYSGQFHLFAIKGTIVPFRSH